MRTLAAATLVGTLLVCPAAPPFARTALAGEDASAVRPAEPDEPGWTRLANGLRVAIRPLADARDVAVLTVFSIGADHDPPGGSGLAHLTEHLVATAAAGEIEPRTCEEMSGRSPGWRAETHARTTDFANVVAPHSLDAELADVAARMGDLRIEQSDLDRERPRVFDQIALRERLAPSAAAETFAVERMYGLPKGGGMGLREDVAKVTLEELRDRCGRYYKPVNARLVITGAIDPAKTLALVEAKFGRLPAGERVPEVLAGRPVWAGRFDVDLSPPGTAAADCERAICITCPRPTPREDPTFMSLGYLVQPEPYEMQEFRFDADEEDRTVSFHWKGDGRSVEDVVKRFDEMVARFAERVPTGADLAPILKASDDYFTGYSKWNATRGECAHRPDWLARNVAEAAEDGVDADRRRAVLSGVGQADLRRIAKTWLGPERRVVAVVKGASAPPLDWNLVLDRGTTRIRVVLTWDARSKSVRHRFGDREFADEAAYEKGIRSYADTVGNKSNAHITFDADPAMPWSEVRKAVDFARRCGLDKFEFTNGNPPTQATDTK